MPTTENRTIVTDQTAPLAALKTMTAQEQLEYVQRQVVALETESAEAWLTAHEMPADPVAVNRLVFSRYLFATLRLKEYAL